MSSYFYGLGRRKSATARVRLFSKKGFFTINEKAAADYLKGSKYLMNHLTKPFVALELDPANYTVSARVTGGGQASQVDAISLGLAKALVSMNDDFRTTLKKADLLSRDSREKERKKFGLLKARKRRQFTKR